MRPSAAAGRQNIWAAVRVKDGIPDYVMEIEKCSQALRCERYQVFTYMIDL